MAEFSRSRTKWLLINKIVIKTILLFKIFSLFPTTNCSSESEVCLTEECRNYASTMLRYMNTSADPCSNFYEFSCGNFDAHHAVKAGSSQATQFSIMIERNSKIIREILERPASSFKTEALQKAKKFYDSCMNLGKINAESLAGIRAIVDDLGGFFLSRNSSTPYSEPWSLTDLLIARTRYSKLGLFSFNIVQDDKNSSRHLISLDHGGVSLPARDYYFNKSVDSDPILIAYVNFLAQVASKILGSSSSDFNLLEEAVKDVVRFEQQLVAIFLTTSKRRQLDQIYSLMTLSDLHELCPSIDWSLFFSSVSQSLGITGGPSKSDEIIVYGKAYFERLHRLLATTTNSTNGRRTLQNYIILKTASKFVSELGEDFRKLYETLQRTVLGEKGGRDLWENCVFETLNSFGFAVGSIYVREHFQESARFSSEAMIAEIRLALKDRLATLPWMDVETRTKALEKVDAIQYNIGYPEWTLDDASLDRHYAAVNISDDNLRNHIATFRYSLWKKFKRLGEKPDHRRWSMIPTEVNAYYASKQNKIAFPAGILQPPFFSNSLPSALNFGGIGVVFGHEIVHAFDDTGRLYSTNGELTNWWNNATDAQFRSRAKCFSRQYSRYSSNGLSIRGLQTVGENIADNGGIKVVYQAFKSSSSSSTTAKNHRKHVLPEVNLSEDQLFFVNFAQIWCAVYSPEALRYKILTASHCPSNFRVHGAVSNSEEFAAAFNCPSPSPMNPKEKCAIF